MIEEKTKTNFRLSEVTEFDVKLTWQSMPNSMDARGTSRLDWIREKRVEVQIKRDTFHGEWNYQILPIE